MATKTILIAMDGSEHSDRALEWYASNLKTPQDQLVFVTVVEPKVARGSSLTAADAPKHVSEQVGNAVRVSQDVQQRTEAKCRSLGLPSDGIRFVEKISSTPGAAIVDAANDVEADLVVMGNRGLGTLRRTFLGSVSDYVLHHAHRPVAVIPPRKS
ncbi:hypothetical protein BOX15_Mlig027821g1 [Macrostomum lignano]|uniref:UspA domain-containing protein n=1 Tax=Macrostomum lignano TaxID=282301 RepID=A0A267FAZ3_9PLAT|nr:hypothetical protein BOX15_Mlig027821g2 [Macrostomum lignano]PAA70950.1 hypothetical protein BOX15_Mlig027821g1 [Macrostomum lignano]